MASLSLRTGLICGASATITCEDEPLPFLPAFGSPLQCATEFWDRQRQVTANISPIALDEIVTEPLSALGPITVISLGVIFNAGLIALMLWISPLI